MTDPAPRITLRGLPLAAKLVLSVFLVTVGIGYFSALIQLHLQHSSREGEALPTMADVVEVFAGVKKIDPNAPPEVPTSRLERLVMGPVEGPPFNGSGSMAAAFFHKDGALYKGEIKDRGKETVDAEREGERQAVRALIRSDEADRKAAYEADRLLLPPDLAGKPITADYLHDDKAAVKVKTILADRCERCHKRGEEQEKFPLETYEHLAKYMEVAPAAEVLPGGWVRSDRQVSVEKLTQSTHAHLLSFAMLFTLTGLTFAFTGYPGLVRGVLAPAALVAEVADIGCWWLARLPDYGPSVAMAIPVTGGIGGIALALQIILSLLDLYGPRGKAVIVLLMAAAAAGFGVLGVRVIGPALRAEREATTRPKEAPPPAPEPATKPQANGSPTPKPIAAGDAPVPPQPAAGQPPHLERLVMGAVEGPKWDGTGSMAAAFFHKDGGGFKRALKADPTSKPQVEAERDGERQVLRAWIHADDTARKAAYETDRFPLPPDLTGRPITADYLDGPAAKVKSILLDRCERCHASGAEQEDHPLETYEQLLKYLRPEK